MFKNLFKRRHVKRYFVNPRFQGSFLIYFALFCELNILIVYITARVVWDQLLEQAVAAGIVNAQDSGQFVEYAHGVLTRLFIVISLESLLVFLMGGLILSHRVAGPLYRVHAALKGIASGERPSPIKFRKLDYFDEIQDAYNSAVQRLVEHGVPAASASDEPVGKSGV